MIAIARRLAAGGAKAAELAAHARDGLGRDEEALLRPILFQVYEGDTLLHVAAAAHDLKSVRLLLKAGADLHARNRRGAEPLHAATAGGPGRVGWSGAAQAAVIAELIAAGADPNVTDKLGVGPLHRAVRNRCSAAVKALLDAGADPKRATGRGTSLTKLAKLTTGRGGTGSLEAKREQEEILRVLGR